MKAKGPVRSNPTYKHRMVLSILLVLLLGACTSQPAPGTPSQPPPTTTPVPPTPVPSESEYWPTEGWRTSTPEEQGMDSEQLAEMMDYLQEQEGFNIHSLLIVRQGHVVTDAYFYPFAQARSLHDLASATKSFMSTLIGIAINQGLIESVGQPVLGFFPERSVANVDASKEAMTVEDLLTMSAGLQCSHSPPDRTTFEMMDSPDWVQFTLDLPMAAEPGDRWVYCSPNPHLLSAILQESSGMNALEFAQEHLFGPLGISDAIWLSDPQGITDGWGNLIMTPHDMAKLGYLYLRDGEWDGQQVLPADWVAAATSPSPSKPNYGYLWWLDYRGSYYYADGAGGQRIFVFPDLDMVVVTTGAGGSDDYGVLTALLNLYILPAAESKTPLPANPGGVASLESRVQQVAASPQPEPVPPLPEIAQQVSGKAIVLESNPVGLQSITLDFPGGAEAALRLTFIDGNQIVWPIGLDKVYRFTPFEHGLSMGVKGEWESDDVLVIRRDVIGGYERERIDATFEEDQITIQIHNLTAGGGGTVTLAGRLEE